MATGDLPEHPWPEDDEPVAVPTPSAKRSWLARIGRAFGDVALTIGMSRGLTGRGNHDQRAITNTILFGEGENQGREASRGSGKD
jgi:hypothetical protein